MLSTTHGECWPALWWRKAKNRVDKNLQFCCSMTQQKCFFSMEGDWVILLKGKKKLKNGSDYAAPSTAGAFCTKIREGGLAGRLWDAAARPGSLGHVHNAIPTPFPAGRRGRHSHRGWRCSPWHRAAVSWIPALHPHQPEHQSPVHCSSDLRTAIRQRS